MHYANSPKSKLFMIILTSSILLRTHNTTKGATINTLTKNHAQQFVLRTLAVLNSACLEPVARIYFARDKFQKLLAKTHHPLFTNYARYEKLCIVVATVDLLAQNSRRDRASILILFCSHIQRVMLALTKQTSFSVMRR